jgi:hypothetical protein
VLLLKLCVYEKSFTESKCFQLMMIFFQSDNWKLLTFARKSPYLELLNKRYDYVSKFLKKEYKYFSSIEICKLFALGFFYHNTIHFLFQICISHLSAGSNKKNWNTVNIAMTGRQGELLLAVH